VGNETGKEKKSALETDTSVKRRGLLRFGTLLTALTGASAISALGADRATAGPGDKNPPTNYVPIAEKGAASGVATLDIGSKIPPAQLPDLSATYSPVSTTIPKWAPATTYAAGQQIVSPAGDVVTAIAGHTSGASFTPGNWAYSRFSDYFFNVKSYGAKGDGVTDDGAAAQTAIDAAAAAGSGVVFFPRGTFVVNSPLTFPTGKQISLRGSGMGGAGYTPGTLLKRTNGTKGIISAIGTSPNNRVSIEICDMEIHGGDLGAADLVLIQRGCHIYLKNLRISHTTGTGLHATEVWDCAFERLIVENCGSGTAPASLFDSVVGGGSNANCATIHITNSIWQGNTGTDVKLTGSIADGSPTNEVQLVNCKLESGTGSQPFIDLDYAQSCSFVNVKILVPMGRNPNAVVQQVNTAASSTGSRANAFVNCTIDSAGTLNYAFDVAVGSLQSVGTTFVATPSVADFRIQSSTAAGRVRIIGPAPHGVSDLRTADEHLGAALGNGSLVGSDITVWRRAVGQLKVQATNSTSGASFVVEGGPSSTVNALQVTTANGSGADNAFASFNTRARIGYDATLASVVIDDGNAGANKPIVLRSQGSPRLTVDQGGETTANTGNVLVGSAGKGFRVREGANAKQGVAILSSGDATVTNTSVTANSRIFLTGQDNNVTGALRVSARAAGTGFSITSSVGTDSGVVAYEIFEPA
jgi:hypothetical protein